LYSSSTASNVARDSVAVAAKRRISDLLLCRVADGFTSFRRFAATATELQATLVGMK
jgi:hypothetical protein